MPARWRRGLLVAAIALCGCTREKVPEYSASGTVPYTPPEQLRQMEPLPCDERAIVVVASPKGLGNGFVFGDGSLVATAYHVIRSASQRLGDHQIQFRPLVLSRYWGDVFEAEIVVTDATSDLAILEVSWPGHPALELATREELSGSQEVISGALIWSGHAHDPTIESARLATERFRVRVGKIGAEWWALSGRVEQMGKGWSGCPIVLAESGKVAGIFNCRALKEIAQATVAWQLQTLAEALPGHPLSRSEELATLQPPADAEVAFAAASRLLLANRKRNDKAAFGIASELLALRPDSPMAHALFARAALGVGHPELAEEYIAEALGLQPDNGYLRFSYACVLEQGCKLEEAEEQLRRLTERENDNPVVWFWLAEFLAEHQPGRREEIQAFLDKAESLNTDEQVSAQELEALRSKLGD